MYESTVTARSIINTYIREKFEDFASSKPAISA